MNEIDRAAEVKAVKSDILRSLHCSLPGHILAFDPSACKAQIQLTGDHMPILKDVPVFMPVKLNIQVDDPCLVVFSDRDITNWLLTDNDVSSPRLHSLSDGIAFVGFGNPDGICDYYTKHEVSDLINNIGYHPRNLVGLTVEGKTSYAYSGVSFTLDKPGLVTYQGVWYSTPVLVIGIHHSATVLTDCQSQYSILENAGSGRGLCFLDAGTYYVWIKTLYANPVVINVTAIDVY